MGEKGKKESLKYLPCAESKDVLAECEGKGSGSSQLLWLAREKGRQHYPSVRKKRGKKKERKKRFVFMKAPGKGGWGLKGRHNTLVREGGKDRDNSCAAGGERGEMLLSRPYRFFWEGGRKSEIGSANTTLRKRGPSSIDLFPP